MLGLSRIGGFGAAGFPPRGFLARCRVVERGRTAACRKAPHDERAIRAEGAMAAVFRMARSFGGVKLGVPRALRDPRVANSIRLT